METFVFMQTRVFRNETQIHIEKIHTRVFSLENAEVGHRKGVYRKIGGLQEKQVKKKFPFKELLWRLDECNKI